MLDGLLVAIMGEKRSAPESVAAISAVSAVLRGGKLVGVLSDSFGGNLSLAMMILPFALVVNAIAWFVGVKRPAHV